MKGHIFNLLLEFIEQNSDLNTVNQILNDCQEDHSDGFANTGNYPDEQLYEIVEICCRTLGLPAKDAHQAFGKWLIPELVKLVPPALTQHAHVSDFLESLDRLHKVELKKLYPDAVPPVFNYIRETETRHRLQYTSRRGLFELVDGCLQGVSAYFDTPFTISRDDQDAPDRCDYILDFA